MDNNEITMFMDVKLDIHNKRPDSLKFKQWTKCEVKIEAIKCLPCYLRVSIVACEEAAASCAFASEEQQQTRQLCVSIIVPGVNISYAASRTKQHSYGLFWIQNRKNCCIYFALETETSCRHHMKWIKKSIKNLELYRQLMLEQTRSSRGPCMVGVAAAETENLRENWQPVQDVDYMQSTYSSIGPLPHIPDVHDGNQSAWSRRVSHTSQIYEEIFENVDGPRLSRRISRTSIASGIYEEMKPTASNFNAIDEEVPELQLQLVQPQPPPLPPLPPPRKRINTFNGPGMLGEIPRSNTNPESELAKKKKYKNMLDNIFGSGRAKRAESVSETQACTADDLINSVTPPKYCKRESAVTPIYVNEAAVKRQNRNPKNTPAMALHMAKRNSFSSPDLSKINYLDTYNGGQVADALPQSVNNNTDYNSSDGSLNNLSIAPPILVTDEQLAVAKSKIISAQSLNISQQISNNFNFSACNTSTINLMGANGATVVPSSSTQKNKILIDDLTGYCVMAPIIKKTSAAKATNNAATTQRAEPSSSGYSTGSSYPSTSSSSAEDQLNQAVTIATTDSNALMHTSNNGATDESTIYEKMHAALSSTTETTGETAESAAKAIATNATTDKEVLVNASVSDFTGNLYENFLAVKASQELEYQPPSAALSTSTPTESPHTQTNTDAAAVASPEVQQEEESYYQTPRKSIISVDEKIPSYYPNSCDTVKTRRQYNTSPQKVLGTTPTAHVTTVTVNEKSATSSTVRLRQLVTFKMRHGERKENLYISSPQSIIEQRQNGLHNSHTDTNKSANAQKASKTQKSLRAGAMKIAEHVYTVKHAAKVQKSNSSNNYNNNNNNVTDAAGFTDDMRERLQTELLQLAMLQKIDFKFDDTKSGVVQAADSATTMTTTITPASRQLDVTQGKDATLQQSESVYENLLHKYKDSWMKKYGGGGGTSSPSAQATSVAAAAAAAAQQSPADLSNGVNLSPKPKLEMHHSCIAGTTISNEASVETSGSSSCGAAAVSGSLSGVKKFASLPRFKKIDFSPLRLKINNVLQRGQQQDF